MSSYSTSGSKCDQYDSNTSTLLPPMSGLPYEMCPRTNKPQMWRQPHLYTEITNEHSRDPDCETLPSSPVVSDQRDGRLPTVSANDCREKSMHINELNNIEQSLVSSSNTYVISSAQQHPHHNADYPMDVMYPTTSLGSWQRLPTGPIDTLMDRDSGGGDALIPSSTYSISDMSDPALMHMALPSHEDLVSTAIIAGPEVDEVVASVLDLSPNPPVPNTSYQPHNGYLSPHCIIGSLHPSSSQQTQTTHTIDHYNPPSMPMTASVYSPAMAQHFSPQNNINLPQYTENLQQQPRLNTSASIPMYKSTDPSFTSICKNDLDSHLSGTHSNHEIDRLDLPQGYMMENGQKQLNIYNELSHHDIGSAKQTQLDYEIDPHTTSEHEFDQYIPMDATTSYRYHRVPHHPDQLQAKKVFMPVDTKSQEVINDGGIDEMKQPYYIPQTIQENQDICCDLKIPPRSYSKIDVNYDIDGTAVKEDFINNQQKYKPYQEQINKKYSTDYPRDYSGHQTSDTFEKYALSLPWDTSTSTSTTPAISEHNNFNEVTTEVVNNPATSCIIDVPSSDSQVYFICSRCQITFTEISELSIHLLTTHNSQLIIRRLNEEKTTPRKSTERKIKQDAQETQKSPPKKSKSDLYFCNHCYHYFDSLESFQAHEATFNKSFKCGKCKCLFTSKEELGKHKKVHNRTEKKENTPEIVKEKKSSSKKGSANNEKKKCDVCDELFDTAYKLCLHRRKHTGERPYKCPKCPMAFRLLSTLKTHVLTHSGLKPFACEICSAKFIQKSALRRHKTIHKKREPIKCKICDMNILGKQNLVKHMLGHELKLQCKECGKEFTTKKKLDIHMVQHSGEERPYKCTECSSSFTAMKRLRFHKVRVHDRERFVTCEECKATFKRMESYRAHKEVHKGDAPFKCEVCGARYNQMSTLRKHMYFHSQDDGKLNKSKAGKLTPSKEKDDSNNKPDKVQSLGELSCDGCSKTFYRNRQLNAHRRFCNLKNEANTKNTKDEFTNVDKFTTKKAKAMKLLTAVLAIGDKKESLEVSPNDTLKGEQEVSYTMPSSFKNYKQKSENVWKKVVSTEPT